MSRASSTPRQFINLLTGSPDTEVTFTIRVPNAHKKLTGSFAAHEVELLAANAAGHTVTVTVPGCIVVLSPAEELEHKATVRTHAGNQSDGTKLYGHWYRADHPNNYEATGNLPGMVVDGVNTTVISSSGPLASRATIEAVKAGSLQGVADALAAASKGKKPKLKDKLAAPLSPAEREAQQPLPGVDAQPDAAKAASVAPEGSLAPEVQPEGGRGSEAHSASREWQSNQITFTQFEPGAANAKVGKTILLNGDKITHPFPSRMVAKLKKLTLAQMIGEIKPNRFWTAGVFDEPTCHVIPKRGSIENPKWPVRNRTKVQMSPPPGPALLVIDNDFAAEQGDTRKELFAAIPELADIEMIEKGSSGSYVGGCLGGKRAGCAGEHLIMGLENGSDLKHNHTVIHKRLILAGFDHSKISAAGSFLKRSAIDGAMSRPVQPCFLAANLADGLTQDLRVRHFPGKLLGRLPDLSKEEEEQYKRLVAQKHDSMIPEMEAARGRWVEKKVKEGWTRNAAVRLANAVTCGTGSKANLEPSAVIELAEGGSVTVADILADPAKFHCVETLDPIDPEYRSGAQVGIIYSNHAPFLIHSQAHGGITYYLGAGRSDSIEDFIEELQAIPHYGVDPEAEKWSAVAITKTDDIDLFSVEIAEGVALFGGLALADGRVVTLTSLKPVEDGLGAAFESSKVGAVATFFRERVIPVLGREATLEFVRSHSRKLSVLGSGIKEITTWFEHELAVHEEAVRVFARGMSARVVPDASNPDGDAEREAADEKAEKLGPPPLPAADDLDRGPECFVALFSNVEYDGKTYRAGLYLCLAAGENKPARDIWVALPIEATARSISDEGENAGLYLRFRRQDTGLVTWAMPRDLLYQPGNKALSSLIDRGFYIEPTFEGTVIDYLKREVRGQKDLTSVAQLGWHHDAYVLPDEIIGLPEGKGVVFQPRSSVPFDNRTVVGTYEGWRDSIGRWAVGNPAMILSICAAFAGPLVRLISGAEGGSFHLWGNSAGGKSTSAIAAASVCGVVGPNGRGLSVGTWSVTSSSLMNLAARGNDGLLVLDEIKEARPEHVVNIVHAITNGIETGRATQSGGDRKQKMWSVLALSTGEISLPAYLQSVGKDHTAGMENRMLDVPVCGSHGALDEAHEFFDPADSKHGFDHFSEAVVSAAQKHAGQPLRMFVRALLENKPELDALMVEMLGNFPCDGRANSTARGAKRFALVALAGELAIEFGIVPWQPGDAIAGVKVMFNSWLDTQGFAGGEERKVIEAFRDHLQRYGSVRYQPLNASPTGGFAVRSYQGCEGYFEASHAGVADFGEDVEKKEREILELIFEGAELERKLVERMLEIVGAHVSRFYLTTKTFDEIAVSSTVNRKEVLRVLSKHGVLPPVGDPRHPHQTRPRTHEGRKWLYPIDFTKLNDITL